LGWGTKVLGLGSWADDPFLVEARSGGPQADGDGIVGAPLAGARGKGKPLPYIWAGRHLRSPAHRN